MAELYDASDEMDLSVWDEEHSRAERLVEAAEAAATMVRVGYAAGFDSVEDRREFYAMFRELLPSL